MTAPSPDTVPMVSVVTVAFGVEPWLPLAVDTALASRGVRAEVILVDNGGTEGQLDELGQRVGVTVVGSGDNVGFAAACNLGVAASTGAFVALLNPDTQVAPDALAELVAVAARSGVGVATAAVVMAEDHDVLTSAGNAVHFLGVSWGGWFGDRCEDHPSERPATAASGAGMVCRREVWEALGGFPDAFFAYYEDAELSLRIWQRGLEVIYVPTAVVVHRYEFSRNPIKYRLLERNRLAMVLTCYGPRQLLVTLPVLVAFEMVMVVYAAAEGWLPAKLSGYVWLARHWRWLRSRRADVQAQRTVTEASLVPLFSDRLQPGNLPPPRALVPFDRVLRAYWHLARRVV